MFSPTTHVFELATTAAPAVVWRAITEGRHLHGLDLVSDWRPGSTVEGRKDGAPVSLRGEVLAAAPPHRLSLVFETTHLTWEITSTAVRLSVDELVGDSAEEAAEVWSPVMASLAEALGASMST
ncbi:MAG TPA: SRPBCC domain-containing protein [Acidimicrobiales bacterium]